MHVLGCPTWATLINQPPEFYDGVLLAEKNFRTCCLLQRSREAGLNLPAHIRLKSSFTVSTDE